MSKRIICINNAYFDALYKSFIESKSSVKPYFNKQILNTRFTRPYICLDYSKHFKYIVCYPLSSFKDKDNIQTKYYRFIIVNKKIRAKIALNCGLIVPRAETYVINTSKDSINKCQKHYKEWLIDLKDELVYCSKNYKFIKQQIKDYIKLNKSNPNKNKLIDKTVNIIFNKKWSEQHQNKLDSKKTK